MIGELIFIIVCVGVLLAIGIAIKLFKHVTRLENETYGKPYIVGFTLTGEKLGDHQYIKFGSVVLRARNADDAREKTMAKLFKRAYQSRRLN